MWEQNYDLGANSVGKQMPPNVASPSANIYNAKNQRTDARYDSVGNQTTIPGICISTSCLGYDAENRLTGFGDSVTYAYDADGHRIVKRQGLISTIYLYDAMEPLVAEYGTGANGPLLCKTCYLSTDYLGSTRMITDEKAAVVSFHDYMPFEEEIGARYYGSALGRFTSPDPEGLGSSTMDPQSWNMYAYARNNPLSFVDPYGFSYQICDANGKNCSTEQLTDDEFASEKQAGQANGESFSNGTLSHTDANGNTVVDGTYRQTDVDLPGDAATNRAAAGFIVANFNNAMTEFGKNAAFAVVGAGIGAGIEAINDARIASKAAADAEDLARYRSAPVGRRGSPMEVGGNTGTEIGGRYYTGHALDRMQGRGLVPSVIEDAIATGTKSPGNTPGTSVFTNSQARVVVNSGGDVISVNPR